MQVVKLGGSLSHSAALNACLTVIARQPDKTVIVPGGGDFAEQVRIAQQRWQFDDTVAHEMAILAMQQMALLFKSLQASFALVTSISHLKENLTDKNAVIWSPTLAELNHAAIPASWDITSDSLAAWLAAALAADELWLVKAAEINTQNLSQLTAQGIVDAAFADFVRDASYPVQIVNDQMFCTRQAAKTL